MLRTAIVVSFLAIYTLLLGPPFILHCVLTGRPDLLYKVGVAGARFALRLGGVRIRAAGLENIPTGVCVFVANHTSNVDPPAVVAAIPRRVALLGKKEAFGVPILGRAFRLAGFVPVDRSNRAAAMASVDQAVAHLKRGTSYLVFPEGTRSPDGRLRAFKKGTFIMAIHAGVPVVPVAVTGAHQVMRKGSAAIHPGTVEVRFLPPVDSRAYPAEQRSALRTLVQDAIAAALPDAQRAL
ncbi:MAG: lysophospholipid acyltransferase family protein [Candidatus Acidiferrales bacterium]